jgi:hypothetical protein
MSSLALHDKRRTASSGEKTRFRDLVRHVIEQVLANSMSVQFKERWEFFRSDKLFSEFCSAILENAEGVKVIEDLQKVNAFEQRVVFAARKIEN